MRGSIAKTLTCIKLQFQAINHECEQMMPILKHHIAQERAHIIEKGFSGSQFFADALILFIKEFKNSMEKEGQQV